MSIDKISNTLFDGMYIYPQVKYNLDGDAFTPEIVDNIHKTTRLCKSDWLGDWWVHEDTNPELTWQQLIDLALNILHTEATRLFVHHFYLKAIPTYKITPFPDGWQFIRNISGAKRVNGFCGEYEEWDQIRQRYEKPRDTGDKFRLSGKDEGCCVEGTWFDWCCFACNILASENTQIMCADLYEPALANGNY